MTMNLAVIALVEEKGSRNRLPGLQSWTEGRTESPEDFRAKQWGTRDRLCHDRSNTLESIQFSGPREEMSFISPNPEVCWPRPDRNGCLDLNFVSFLPPLRIALSLKGRLSSRALELHFLLRGKK